jgi:hypothetical protein
MSINDHRFQDLKDFFSNKRKSLQLIIWITQIIFNDHKFKDDKDFSRLINSCNMKSF